MKLKKMNKGLIAGLAIGAVLLAVFMWVGVASVSRKPSAAELKQALTTVTPPEGFTKGQVTATEGSKPDCFDICTSARFEAHGNAGSKTRQAVLAEAERALTSEGWEAAEPPGEQSDIGVSYQRFDKNNVCVDVEVREPTVSGRMQLTYAARPGNCP